MELNLKSRRSCHISPCRVKIKVDKGNVGLLCLFHKINVNRKMNKMLKEDRAEAAAAEGYLTHMCHGDIAYTIHQANKAKGFWPEDAHDRDFGQVNALIHGEIDEAFEASWANGQDDKLPQYSGVAVELVDTIIRLYDALGAYVDSDVDEIVHHASGFARAFLDGQEHGSLNDKLMVLHFIVSKALDAHRKSVQTEFESNCHSITGPTKIIQCPQYHVDLATALIATQYVCDMLGIVWEPIMDAKFAFNQKRPHKHGAKY